MAHNFLTAHKCKEWKSVPWHYLTSELKFLGAVMFLKRLSTQKLLLIRVTVWTVLTAQQGYQCFKTQKKLRQFMNSTFGIHLLVQGSVNLWEKSCKFTILVWFT